MPRLSFLLRLPIVLMLAHVYVAMRLASAVSPALSGVVLVLFGLIFLLILVGFFTRRSAGSHGAADVAAWCGFVAMGLFSWLFVLTVLRDVVLLPAHGVAYWVGRSVPEGLRLGSAALVVLGAVIAVIVGFWLARRRAPVVTVDVPIAGLPEVLSGFTLVQISDLHVGPTIKQRYVAAVVQAANGLAADAIVLTGDLVDGEVERLAPHVAPLAQLRAPHGVYAVTGNHEYYSGAEPWVAAFGGLGMKVLMNQHEVVDVGGEQLVIAGVTDFSAETFIASHASSPQQALRGAPQDAALRILLAHQPRSAIAAAEAGFDLQLSGHTHGGQFWPWKYFVPMQQPYLAGLYQHDRMWVYVSRGTGYWGPPMRVGAPSEITCIRLTKA